MHRETMHLQRRYTMQKRLIQRLAALAATAFLTSTAWAGDFSSSYSAGLFTTYSIKGTEPASGKHPVFIYTVGTTEDWDNGQAMAAVAEMAAKGFVAAAVQYDSSAVRHLLADPLQGQVHLQQRLHAAAPSPSCAPAPPPTAARASSSPASARAR